MSGLKQWSFVLAVAITTFTAVDLLYPRFSPRHLRSSAVAKSISALKFTQARFDAGEITADSVHVIRHEYEFQNISDKPVELRQVQSTCGCTVASGYKKTYQPGERGSIVAEMSLAAIGPKSVQLLVHSSATGAPQVLELNALYSPPSQVEAIPAQVELKSSDGHSVRGSAVTVHLWQSRANADASDAPAIAGISSVHGKVLARVVNNDIPAEYGAFGYRDCSFTLTVFASDQVAGEFEDELVLRFSSAKLRDLRIPVVGRVVDEWQLEPKRVLFVIGESGALAAPRSISLVHEGPFELAGVSNPFESWLEIGPRADRAAPKASQDAMTIIDFRMKCAPPDAESDGEVLLTVSSEGRLTSLRIPISVARVASSH